MIKQDLITAIDKAKSAFKAIMDNDPGLKELKGYLVLSSSHGQFQITDDPLETLHILKEFPTMISESEFKEKGIKLLETIQGLEVELKNAAPGNTKAKIQKKIENASNLLNANLQKIEFKEDTFIEIRFKRPVLDLIFKMQKNPFISQAHTPQTQASIRIVLGTLIELAQRMEKLGANKDEHKQL
jgi:hypothetical protein